MGKTQAQDYEYEELKYISQGSLQRYVALMSKCGFYVPDLDEEDAEHALNLLGSIIEKHPYFLPAYEDLLNLINCYEPNLPLEELKLITQKQWIATCFALVKKENLTERYVSWSWMENRPLMRGIYASAQGLWEAKHYQQANEQFKLLLSMNPNDNIGARYAEKATGEEMPYEDFEVRFVQKDESGSYYNIEALTEWFESLK